MLYLTKINNVYYVRLRVPSDLSCYFGRLEIKKSLKTKRYTNAKALVIKISAELEKAFTIMRTGYLTDEQMHTFAADFIDKYLDKYEKAKNNAFVYDDVDKQKDVDEFRKRQEKRLENAESIIKNSELFNKKIQLLQVNLAQGKPVKIPAVLSYVDRTM